MTSRPLPRIEINPPPVARTSAIALFIHHLTLAIAYFEATQPEDLPAIKSMVESLHSSDEVLSAAIPAFASHLNHLYQSEETTT